MHHVLRVTVLDCFQNSLNDLRNLKDYSADAYLVLSESAPVGHPVSYHVEQLFALEELHDDVNCLLVFVAFDVLGHIGVVESLQLLHFLHQFLVVALDLFLCNR